MTEKTQKLTEKSLPKPLKIFLYNFNFSKLNPFSILIMLTETQIIIDILTKSKIKIYCTPLNITSTFIKKKTLIFLNLIMEY